MQLIRYQINKSSALDARIEKNTTDIAALKENSDLRSQIEKLQEDTARLNQYTRKDVLIVTGMDMDKDETPATLYEEVIGMFCDICNRTLTAQDYVAIHRNGTVYKGKRPPTITVKFVRFTDKDLLFFKPAREARASRYPKIKFHHNLCKALINEIFLCV